MTDGAGHDHRPVLYDEVLEVLALRPDGIYLDGTFGRGGHSAGILAQLGEEGRLLASDKDPAAVTTAQRRFGADPRFAIIHGSFTDLVAAVAERGWLGRVDGILLDLGVSSPQLDDASRGFSFQSNGPLDMRMDPSRGQSAAQWLAQADEEEIALVLKEYGEERHARRIARAIVGQRGQLRTTADLAELIARANPSHEKHKHPATRSFQAIRIYINQELEDLEAFLRDSVDLLARAGRLVVISFHSLEDRIVKRFIRDEAANDAFPPDMPIPAHLMQGRARLKPVGKAIKAGTAEVAANPRARSAVLRVAERL